MNLPERHKAGSYMDWLAHQPCLCCSSLGITERRVILHHLHVWGLPRKRNNPLRDLVTVPLCPRHHDDTGDAHAAHRMKQEAWLGYWGLGSADELLERQLRAYIATRWLPRPPAGGARELAEWLLAHES